MTKDQVINFLKIELECGNSILVSTLGNGGSGEAFVNDAGFPDYLESLEFVGQVVPSSDISESDSFDSSWLTFQFNGTNGFYIQVHVFVDYDY